MECDQTVLRCEAPAVSRAIRNLIENADRYGPKDGRIRIRAGQIGSSWSIAVDDQGPGIPEERRSEVFERFARSGGDSAGSTGLGLAIVRAVAEAHQGTVSVSDSDLGGASFRIQLPAAPLG
jgi:signal transduction histidine kinase